ncbi:hypothetical protein FXO38_33691 [Capsicum annuum]|nr:hypothetical protein FXO38_33691 [Capsicum annuum]
MVCMAFGKGAVLTQENLMKRGITICPRCFLCGENEETVNHLFLHCKITGLLWRVFLNLRGVSWCMPGKITEALLSWDLVGMQAKSRSKWRIVPASIWWSIWKERNSSWDLYLQVSGNTGSKRKSKIFKDEEYFISAVPTNQHFEAGLSVRGSKGFESNRLDAAVLDLVADDKNGLQKQKVSYHWDKRSKKYIKLNNGDRVTASGKIKTESGSKMKSNKTGIYKKWKDRSHKRVSLNGTNDGNFAAESTSLAGGPRGQGGSRNFRGGRNNKSVPNAHLRSEIKDVDQVRKEREKKAQRASYLKTKKGKKGFKGGKKGRGNGNGKGRKG